jgi:hypothetical protein
MKRIDEVVQRDEGWATVLVGGGKCILLEKAVLQVEKVWTCV